jgi:hypothetical protein
MPVDGRSLDTRVRALARRFDAMATGAEKRSPRGQVADNHRRDASTLHEAADALERHKAGIAP